MSPMEAYSETPTKLTPFDHLIQSPESEKSDSGRGVLEQHLQVDEGYPSGCECLISGEKNEQKHDNGLILNKTRIHEGDKTFEMIKNKLVSSLSCHGFAARVEAINRSDYSSCIMKQVRYRSFSLYSKGMEIKRNGNANVKYAWYGASRDELNNILDHGFNLPDRHSGLYGPAVYLSPVDQPVHSLQSVVPDENGIRDILLCRVILGYTEAIRPGSGQYKPSSEAFDSGVDNLMCPNKYIVWNGNMNTHILPEFIVSFRSSACSCRCEAISQKAQQQPRRVVPTSDWMPFASLIKDLSKFLPPDAVELISKHHSEYKEHKITRGELIQQLRYIAGDKLLIAIIKSCRNRSKHTGASELQLAKTRRLQLAYPNT